MPGPAPKEPSLRARRNNPKAGFRKLDPNGRGLPAPDWPLLPDPTTIAHLEINHERMAALAAQVETTTDGRTKGRLQRELDRVTLTTATLERTLEQQHRAEAVLWDELWAMPQAILWEDAHAEREVAEYVRWKLLAERGDSKAATSALQRSDRLGLTPMALLRLRAEIEHVDAAEAGGQQRRAAAKPATTRRKKGGDDPRSGLYAVS